MSDTVVEVTWTGPRSTNTTDKASPALFAPVALLENEKDEVPVNFNDVLTSSIVALLDLIVKAWVLFVEQLLRWCLQGETRGIQLWSHIK